MVDESFADFVELENNEEPEALYRQYEDKKVNALMISESAARVLWEFETETECLTDKESHIEIIRRYGLEYFVLRKETTEAEMELIMKQFRRSLFMGRQVAIVVDKDAFEYNESGRYRNENCILREEAIKHIVEYAGKDPIVSTTGKASRELFEIRESRGEGHQTDFLTVGSMGHSSSIAMEIALQKPESRIWCIDGDGAALMHMGAMAVIGHYKPKNMVEIEKACRYSYAVRVKDLENLDKQLEEFVTVMSCT